jgi:hypothetical protein
MRSELVFGALAHVPNRFLLTKLAATATRKFHRPNTRVQETMDEVFVRFGQADPTAGAKQTGDAQRLRITEKTKRDSREASRKRAAA